MSNVSGKHGYIDNIEFAVSDIERSREFYGSVFTGSLQFTGPDTVNLLMEGYVGGFTTLSEPKPSGGALVILYTDDLEATRLRLEKAGAAIVKPEFSFPGGRRFHFTDPDGYELAVWTDN